MILSKSTSAQDTENSESNKSEASTSKLKVINWNVNSIRARLDLAKLLIEEEKPDVLILQETKTTDETFPFTAFPDYTCHLYGQPQYNGVAILTHKKLGPVTSYALPIAIHEEESKSQTRFMRVDIGELAVYSVYVPCGDGPEKAARMKANFFEGMISYLVANKDRKAIVAGDFNVAMTDKDVEFPQRFALTPICMPEFRNFMRRLTAEADLVDVYRPSEPKNPYTWWHYFGYKFYKKGMINREIHSGGLRIDYIFFSRSLMDSLKGEEFFWVLKKYRDFDSPKPSDHAPIAVSLSID